MQDKTTKSEQKTIDNRISNGWKLMIVGSLIGFASCLIAILDLVPDYRGLCLYGLTSIGVTMAFIGCYLVMER
jgi:hypothetical protein